MAAERCRETIPKFGRCGLLAGHEGPHQTSPEFSGEFSKSDYNDYVKKPEDE